MIKEVGLAKSIGVSNFNVEQLQAIMKVANVKPAVNQIHLHPYNYAENKALLGYCAKLGIVVEVYGTLASITTRPLSMQLRSAAVQHLVKSSSLGREPKGLSSSRLSYCSLFLNLSTIIFFSTSSSKRRLHEYLDAADIDPLTEEEVMAIDEAGAKSSSLVCAEPYIVAIVLCFLLLLIIAGHGDLA